jgi:short-subunit dehydrogenase
LLQPAKVSRCQGVKVDIVTADLGKPDAARALWAAASASSPIDILINNAGFGYCRRFDDVDWARDAGLIQLNMTSLVALAQCFVDACKGRTAPAHMLNIASTAPTNRCRTWRCTPRRKRSCATSARASMTNTAARRCR